MADLFTKYNCTNCQDDITGIRVHCAECTSFDLCLQCFAAGAEIGEHLNSHAYQFMDTGTAILSIFRGKGSWSAREELRLLDAIEKYGFGNWEDISKHIETKSPEDAREEYVNKFLNGTIGRHTWIPAQSQRPQLMDHTEEDTGPLSRTALQKLPPLDVTQEEAAQLGYMPNRDSFEREYDPTAEQLISSLSLNVDDTEADYLLKLAHVDMYTRRLRERVRRKRIVRDYQLVANFFRNKNQQHPRLSREQRDFRDRFRVFAQFYTANEYERLLASLEREKELRIRLSELLRYRWNGLTKFDECRHFEQHAAAAQHRNTGPYGHGKTDNHSTGNHRQLSLQSQHNKKVEFINVNEEKSNSIGQKLMHPTGVPICSVELSHSKNSSDSCRGLSNHTMNSRTGMISTNLQHQQSIAIKSHNRIVQTKQEIESQPAVVDVQLKHEQKLEKQGEKNLLQQQQQLQQQSAIVQQQEQPSQPTVMSNILKSQLDQVKHLSQPLGSNLLSSNEIQLCNILNVAPTNYLSLKTVLLSGAPLSSNLSPLENSIRKYLITAGWLSH